MRSVESEFDSVEVWQYIHLFQFELYLFMLPNGSSWFKIIILLNTNVYFLYKINHVNLRSELNFMYVWMCVYIYLVHKSFN